MRGVKRTRERRCDQLKSTQHFIPQSLQRGDLVMTTGGHGTCSMTPQQENALRSIARQANSEIKKSQTAVSG